MSYAIDVFNWQYDEKLKAFSLMTTVEIGDYLRLTNGTEENLEIQRKIISTKRARYMLGLFRI